MKNANAVFWIWDIALAILTGYYWNSHARGGALLTLVAILIAAALRLAVQFKLLDLAPIGLGDNNSISSRALRTTATLYLAAQIF